MRGSGRDGATDREAADWFARMHGPDRDGSRLKFERWRAADPAHREAYAEAERLWQLSAALAGTEIGRARQLPERRPPFWALPAARPAFAAIAVLLLLGLGYAVLRPWQPGKEVSIAAAQPQESRVGEIRTLRLSDGSSVILDTDSAIEIGFSRDARFVRLVRGRARFDVAADPARAFRVEAGGRTVTALGTLFDVGFEPEGVRVTLLRGSADVRGLAPPGGVAAVARLAAGECFLDGGRARAVAKAPKGIEQWASGMLSFDGAPLSLVLEQTNRYSPRKIRLADPSLGALRVTGVFRPLPVDELAAAIAASFSLSIEPGPSGDLTLRRD